jgi:glycine/D-amino acid oxidase-like deaminating enzyme
MVSLTYDLIVIGGGYWGAGIAYEAKKRGKRVIVLDSKDPLSGSRNASAICDPSSYKSPIFSKYFPSDWSKEDLDNSLSWLIERGGKVTQEGFLNSFQGRSYREGAKAIYIDSNETITGLVDSQRFEVENIIEDSRRVSVWEGESCISCTYLVLAGGYSTDKLLEDSGLCRLGVSKLYGRGILSRGTTQSKIPVSVMIKPYVKHTIRRWGKRIGEYRVGDTAENTPKETAITNLRIVQNTILKDVREINLIEGYRPIADKFLVEKISPRIVVATGGHRVGLGLTGLVAKKALEKFK